MKILIIRNSATKKNINYYNMQEIGLAKALTRKGHKCDIVYYTNEKKISEQKLKVHEKEIAIFWVPALNLLGNPIYIQLFYKKFFKNYDVIQTGGYNKIMTYLLSYINKPVVIYEGQYRNTGFYSTKVKNIIGYYLNTISDGIFLGRIQKKGSYVIAKSKPCEHYLYSKNFNHVYSIGVGLDTTKFDENIRETPQIIKIIEELKENGKKLLLFVGSLDERKNISFLLKVFKEISLLDQDIKLILIGKGKTKDTKKYFEYAKKNKIIHKIVHIKTIEQKYLKKIYEMCHIFLLPSKYEIFGMVLLESMYLKLPVITSNNGGSSTLLKDGWNGFVINDFHTEQWKDKIMKLLSNEALRSLISNHAKKTIEEKYTWDHIVDSYLRVYQKAIYQNF